MILKTIEQLEALTPSDLIQEKQDMDEYRKELLLRATQFSLTYRYLLDEMKCRLDVLMMEELITEDDRIHNFKNYDILCRIH